MNGNGNGAMYKLATLKHGVYSGRIFTMERKPGDEIELTFLFGKERGTKLGKYPKDEVVVIQDL